MKRFGLLPRIITAIILGTFIGPYAPTWFIRIFSTFNHLFNNFLSFVIPFIIIGFIAPGIGSMGRGAGRLLAITTGLAYGSTIIAGLIAFITSMNLYPVLLKGQGFHVLSNPENSLLRSFFTIQIEPIMSVMSALVLSFLLGIGVSITKGTTLLQIMKEFHAIIEKVIQYVILPLLPIYIFGSFSNMAHGGQVGTILTIFLKVFLMIICLHLSYLLIQYIIAGIVNKKNPLTLLKTMIPVYFTALGTQSSAAVIPVTLKQSKKMGVREPIANFSIPLLATIHLSGSTITITSCALAVLYLQGGVFSFVQIVPFVLLLGITMIAAPSVPGGGVMAALGLLESILGFDQTMISLMIALYVAQDSFGTACNVTGDGAIASITNKLTK